MRVEPGARRGRPPSLSPRGRLVGVGAVALVAAGLAADRVDLLGYGIGAAALLFFAILGQYPVAVFIWRSALELAWRVERPAGDPALYPGRALTLSLELRNRAAYPIGSATLRPIASPSLETSEIAIDVAAAADVRVSTKLTPRAVGPAMLHGAVFEATDALGLTHIEAYFPSAIPLSIVPRPAAPLPAPAAVRLSGPERAQRSAARLAGQGGELRELREHRPGDPWKHIAWKATARRGRVMVREMERETQSAHLVLVDASGPMRDARPGRAPFDLAVELAARYARTALEAGDQLGLAMVDARILAQVPMSDRPGQRRFVTEALSGSASYDEDTTDISDAELCATVGRYLLMQEGVDARVRPPPIDDPKWARLIAAPSGELYELSRLVSATWEARERLRRAPSSARAPRAGDDQMSELRAFCRERAIPLPWRADRGRGVRGILQAFTALRGGHAPDRVLVLSTLDGLEPADGPAGMELAARLGEALARLRRRGARVLVVAPLVEEPGADPVAGLLALERERRAAAYEALGRRLGVPIAVSGDPLRFRWPRAAAARSRAA